MISKSNPLVYGMKQSGYGREGLDRGLAVNQWGSEPQVKYCDIIVFRSTAIHGALGDVHVEIAKLLSFRSGEPKR